MAKLPDQTALGETPIPVLPRRTPMISSYRPSSGFEEMPSQELGVAAHQTEEAAHALLEAKIAQDAIRVDDIDTQLKQARMDLSYGPDGFIQKRGADAVNAPLLKDYGGKLDEVAGRLEGSLDNDFQKQMFRKRAQAQGIGMREDLVRHIANQTDVYADTAFKSGMDVDAKLAGTRFDKPDSDVLAIASMQQRIDLEASRRGLKGDVRSSWVNEQTMAARSSVYANMVKQALVSDPVKGPFAAEALLKVHGAELDANTRVILTHEVNAAVLPLQYRATAQDAIKNTLPQAGTAMELGGQPTLDKVSAAQARPPGFPMESDSERADQETRALDLLRRELGEAKTDAERANIRKEIATGEARLKATPQSPQSASPRTQPTKIDAMALMGEAVAKGEEAWLKAHPGDTVGAAHVTANVKEYFGTIAQSLQAEQKKNYSTLIAALMPVAAPGQPAVAPPTTQEQLFSNSANRAAFDALDPLQQSGVLAHLQHNMQASLGHPMREDANVLEQLSKRVFLDAGDQNKITNTGQLIPYLNHGLGTGGFNFLNSLIDKSQSVNGQKFAVAAQRAYLSAKSTLQHSLVGSVNPDAAADAANQYYIELQTKIDDYQQGGKDARTLLTPGTPDSMVDRAKVMSYMQITPRAALAQDVAKQKAAAAKPPVVLSGKSDAELESAFDALPPGARYRAPGDPDGSFRVKPGEPPAPVASATVTSKPAVYEGYIQRKPRGGSFYIEAPARSAAKSLEGQTFATREEALAALRGIFGSSK